MKYTLSFLMIACALATFSQRQSSVRLSASPSLDIESLHSTNDQSLKLKKNVLSEKVLDHRMTIADVNKNAERQEAAYSLAGPAKATGLCVLNPLTLFNEGCGLSQDSTQAQAVIGLVFNIDGPCFVTELCWTEDGGAETCVNLSDNGLPSQNGDTLYLQYLGDNVLIDMYYTVDLTTSPSSSITTLDCSGLVPGCTDVNATNFNSSATIDDGSCLYDQLICDCAGTAHTIGVLSWLGDTFADDGTFSWEGQPVDFNCETWAYDCGDIVGAPTADPWGVCQAGGLPPNNGCGSACTALGLSLFDAGCQFDSTSQQFLPIIGMIFDIDGTCFAQDLCWFENGVDQGCVSLPDAGLFVFDEDTLFLTNTAANAVYDISFTTSDGPTGTFQFTTDPCTIGCVNPFAVNYDPTVDVGDNDTCVYDDDICDCAGTTHSIGVLTWLGDGLPDDGGFDWEGQAVDFNCETWAYDCGDIVDSPSVDPHGVCLGDLPPGNGCSTCTGDLTGDGIVDINDFLILNTSFGSSCSGCPSDMTGDGLVDINDFLVFNTAFGTICP